jgi:hypothetical protein
MFFMEEMVELDDVVVGYLARTPSGRISKNRPEFSKLKTRNCFYHHHDQTSTLR